MKAEQKEFIVIDKITKKSQVVLAIDKHHASAIAERLFNTEVKNIKTKKL
jgi:hypothetical protein